MIITVIAYTPSELHSCGGYYDGYDRSELDIQTFIDVNLAIDHIAKLKFSDESEATLLINGYIIRGDGGYVNGFDLEDSDPDLYWKLTELEDEIDAEVLKRVSVIENDAQRAKQERLRIEKLRQDEERAAKKAAQEQSEREAYERLKAKFG